jgi:hypothetical protein
MPTISVPKMGSSHRSADFAILLPFPNFRESARSMCYTALHTCTYGLKAIALIEEQFPDGFYDTFRCQIDFSRAWQFEDRPQLFVWAALWAAYPAQRCVYAREILKAHTRDPWRAGSYAADEDRRLLEHLDARIADLLGVDFKYTEAVARRWAEEIPWLGNDELHTSHRMYLLQNNREWYRHYGWEGAPCRVSTPEGCGYRNTCYELWMDPDAAQEGIYSAARYTEEKAKAEAQAAQNASAKRFHNARQTGSTIKQE